MVWCPSEASRSTYFPLRLNSPAVVRLAFGGVPIVSLLGPAAAQRPDLGRLPVGDRVGLDSPASDGQVTAPVRQRGRDYDSVCSYPARAVVGPGRTRAPGPARTAAASREPGGAAPLPAPKVPGWRSSISGGRRRRCIPQRARGGRKLFGCTSRPRLELHVAAFVAVLHVTVRPRPSYVYPLSATRSAASYVQERVSLGVLSWFRRWRVRTSSGPCGCGSCRTDRCGLCTRPCRYGHWS